MIRSCPILCFCVFLQLLILPFAEGNEKPNIVFFFTDDQTSSALACYGNPIARTPHIDALAQRGTRFSNSFVSHSICWVSRTTILSGLTGRSFGTAQNPDQATPESVQELYSDILRSSGYRTAYFGKWHAKMPKGYKQSEHFDEFEAIGRNPFYKPQPDGTYRHETDLIVDRGIEFLKKQSTDQPFHINMWFNACHAEDGDRRPGVGHFPWPQSADGMYDDIEMYPPKLNDPAIFEAQPDFFKTTINRERFFWRWNSDYKYQTNMRAYFRMVSGIDLAIGRFVKELENAGLSENTIIVYSADNGFHMGNRGFAGKWSHYEESLRVPLIIADPRSKKKGQVTDAMALNLDLPATFLDWAGAEIPQRYQGRSLRPVVESGKPEDWRTETYHEHFAVRNRIPAFEGIRNDEFKYVRYFDHGNFEMLHDLKNDPDELVNLADDPKYADLLSEMRDRTTKRVDELGGPIPPLEASAHTASTAPHPPIAAMLKGNPKTNDGFVKIFDGKSLRGWTGDKKFWSVKEGALTGVCDGSLKMNRFITWKNSTVRNFDLRLQVKISKGGNSGIQYRSKMRPDLGLDIAAGYQCDVVANIPKYNGMLYEEKGRRILSHTGEKVIIDGNGQPWVIGDLPSKEFTAGEWHEYRVLVKGNHHRHWIDGHPTADLIDFDEKGRTLEGVLGFQVHVGPAMTVQYKDIQIKHLPDDLPLLQEKNYPIPPSAYGVRPQGKLPSDWKAPIYGKQKGK